MKTWFTALPKTVKYMIGAFVVIVLVLAIASTAKAQPQQQNCAPHSAVQQKLGEEYGETRQAIGLGQNDTAVEVWANLQTRTWTITVTSADGPTCLVAAGEAYEAVKEPAPVAGDPA